MPENYLREGQVRVGWLYPGKVQEGEGIPATLARKNKLIQLLVQVKSRKDSSPATRWGMNSIPFGDDPGVRNINIMHQRICILLTILVIFSL